MGKSNNILIIDDERSLLRLSQMILQKKGFDVAVALSSKEGKKIILKENNFKLIILDLMMPEENGFEFLKWKDEQDDAISNIPVIVNTAKNVTPADRVRMGPHYKTIIIKGIDFSERLIAEVESIFSN